MICDAEKQLFKAVIVYRLDRFARNRFDSVLYKSRLAQYKVNVVSATECIPEGSDGVLIEALHEALAQKYSDDLSQIIRRGLYGNAEHCKSNGPLPFGYKANPTTRLVEIDEETAPIVKQIFTMIAEGSNYNQALAYCTRMGYPKTKSALYHILRNERYKGIYIYTQISAQKAAFPVLFPKSYLQLLTPQGKSTSTSLTLVPINICSLASFTAKIAKTFIPEAMIPPGGGKNPIIMFVLAKSASISVQQLTSMPLK